MATVTKLEQPVATTTTRMLSLDVLRGITIAFMIMVNNNGGHAYWPFEHSAWSGWTPTDLVFPTFLYVVGVTIVFSLESRLSRGVAPSAMLPKIFRRFVILFCLGLFVNGFPYFPWAHLRIYGVLQRIAICYLIASLLYLWDRRASTKVAILVFALVAYFIIMRWVPVPGYGVPGRNIPFLDKDANMVAWLDRHIFPGRLYEGVRDPEGLLSDLPALGTTLLGMLTAIWLRTSNTLQRKCAGLLGAGVVCILLGELWNPWFPINKKLWTSSYVLFAGGISMVAWALLMWMSEIRGWKKGWTGFWLVFGVNAISAYVLSEVLSAIVGVIHVAPHESLGQAAFAVLYTVIHPAGTASLAYSICFMLVCWVPMAVLYKRKIFLKV